MFKSYLKIAFRNLHKKKFYSFINILGLAIGMACCLVITLYVLDELSYDRFHKKSDRIYRIGLNIDIGELEVVFATSNDHMAEVLTEEIPEIEAVVRIKHVGNNPVQYEEELFMEEGVFSVDSTFFQVFTYHFIQGNPEHAFKEPGQVVITQATAQKYFGNEQETALNKMILINKKPYVITGVIENPPTHAHFHFDFLIPFGYEPSKNINWLSLSEVRTYVLLKQGSRPDALSSKLYELFKKYSPGGYAFEQQSGGKVAFFVQPLTDIHLHSHLESELEANGYIQYIYILSAIAVFIMLIACVNFINLTTARSADRAKEIGIRKTLGSLRSSLITQILIETFLLSLLALLIGLGMAELFKIPFSTIVGKDVEIDFFSDLRVPLVALVITLLAGLAAGLYPAFYLTKFNPIVVLKGKLSASKQGRQFRNTLVVFQFVISTGLMICTFLMFRQLQYLQHKNLGMNKENVLIIDKVQQLGNHQESFIHQLKAQTSVLSLSASKQPPLAIEDGNNTHRKGAAEEESQVLRREYIDDSYLSTMQISVEEGRNFSYEIASNTAAMILNQAAVKVLGLEQPLEGIIVVNGRDYHVIGVTNNFHYTSPQEEIAPLMLLLATNRQRNVLEVRLQPEDISSTLTEIEKIWRSFAPDMPFTYTFLDQDFEVLFKAEQRVEKLFSIFTGLAIFVACLGLLALAAFTAEQRTKEIGIRKVLGASVKDIVLMLSGNFTKLVGIAFMIAIPLAWYAMHLWLQDFAYRINIDAWTFVIAGATAILIAWLTISFQAIKAARSNPVDALRYE